MSLEALVLRLLSVDPMSIAKVVAWSPPRLECVLYCITFRAVPMALLTYLKSVTDALAMAVYCTASNSLSRLPMYTAYTLCRWRGHKDKLTWWGLNDYPIHDECIQSGLALLVRGPSIAHSEIAL